METFVWDKHFTTGLARVDEQHHELVRLINRLGESLIAGEGGDAASLQAHFAELADYARCHFAEEEHLMQQAGVAARHREPHGRHHAEFVEQLASMWGSRASMAQPAEALHGFLRSWLGFHILGEDQAMARQIAWIRGGKSPEEAFDIDEAHDDNPTNALLDAIGNLYQVLSQQNAELAAANQRLEDRVAERTRALASSNEALSGLNRRLEVLSNSDGLLGIANRRHFDARLAEEWRRAARERQPLSLLMLDVDHFKRYNDRYGHPAGDRCLQEVARAAGSPLALRRPGDLLARYGGEELAVLLPNTGAEGASAVAERIRGQIAALHIAHASSPVAPEVTVSIGVATLDPGPRCDGTALLAAADGALYAAKQGGRNRVCPAAASAAAAGP